MKGISFFAFAAICLALPSCAGAKEVAQSDLDAISDSCHLDRSAMQLEEKNTLRFQPPADTKFEALDCALRKLKEAKFSNMKMGFVGNERYDPELDNNAQKN